MLEPVLEPTLARAALYRLLALGFSYPESQVLSKTGALAAELSQHPSLAGEGPIEEGLREALDRVSEAFSVPDLELDGLAGDLAYDYDTLFFKGNGCAPNETAYVAQSFAKARDLADIAGFYRAFGLESSEERRELPDFVGSELEFMAIVLARQAYAESKGSPGKAGVCAEAGRQFMDEHLGRWLPAFCREVQARSGDNRGGEAYSALALLAERFVAAELALMGLEPKPLAAGVEDAEAGEQVHCDPKFQ